MLLHSEVLVGDNLLTLRHMDTEITRADFSGMYLHYDIEPAYDFRIVALQIPPHYAASVPIEFQTSKGLLLPVEVLLSNTWLWLLRSAGVIWPRNTLTMYETLHRGDDEGF